MDNKNNKLLEYPSLTVNFLNLEDVQVVQIVLVVQADLVLFPHLIQVQTNKRKISNDLFDKDLKHKTYHYLRNVATTFFVFQYIN